MLDRRGNLKSVGGRRRDKSEKGRCQRFEGRRICWTRHPGARATDICAGFSDRGSTPERKISAAIGAALLSMEAER